MKNIKMIIAAHKKYQMPENDLYVPLHVGAEGKNDLGYQKDNTGENISIKNPYYCELTGLYWAWKNLNADYIGVSHYRRYLKGSYKFKVNNKIKKIISLKDTDEVLEKTDIILPKKRNYYIETLYSHYDHTMYIETLDKTGEIIEKDYPEYLNEFKKLKTRRSAHMFNMFVMKKDKLNEYCTWLFDILAKLERNVDSTKYDSFHARFPGRVSELLLDVWLNTKGYDYKEVGFVNIEKVNWWVKGISFLKAKFGKKKYGKSF